MYFKGNSKINSILQSSKKVDASFKFSSDTLASLFNKKIIKIYDAHILENIGKKTPNNLIEKNFEKLISMNTDLKGYECSVNEFKLVDNFDSCLSAPQQFVLGQIVMESLMTKKDFPIPSVVYFTYDEEDLIMRFHKYRACEGLWTSDDLEAYEEPVGYYFIDSNL